MPATTTLQPHKEVPVKVTAWVDEGVAALVLALNEFPELQTSESCQGDMQEGAYVVFFYRGNSREAATFMADLSGALTEHGVSYTLRIEWRENGDNAVLWLTCAHSQVDQLANLIRAFHTNGFSRDTHGTKTRSSRPYHCHRVLAPLDDDTARRWVAQNTVPHAHDPPERIDNGHQPQERPEP